MENKSQLERIEDRSKNNYYRSLTYNSQHTSKLMLVDINWMIKRIKELEKKKTLCFYCVSDEVKDHQIVCNPCKIAARKAGLKL